MKKSTKENNNKQNATAETNKELLKQQRQELTQSIIELTDAETGKRFTDEALDRESLKYQLALTGKYLVRNLL